MSFLFGAATAAYQIEGAWDRDGKGPSNWDTLAHRPGGLAKGATGDVACGHYDRLDSDLDLISRLGIGSYRFSVSWPRIQPDGKTFNAEGFAFYDRLVDGLLARGVAPALTVYHWDHPQALEERGGWLERDMAYRFADYAEILGARLGDRVAMWMTVNEPMSVMMAGINGCRIGGPLELGDGLRVGHHLLLGHALAAGRLRDLRVAGQIGIALNLCGVEPASDDPADLDAAQRARAFEDRLFLDPVLLGRYPDLDGLPVPAWEPEMSARVDFLGVNWYAPAQVRACADSVLGYARVAFAGASTNLLGWPILPERFAGLLEWLRLSYPQLPPVYITENGMPLADEVAPDWQVHDAARWDYMRRCLEQVRSAIAQGMDIRGYFAWSLLDNLEWEHGYGPRFGLVHVDFDTLQRTAKGSFYRYQKEMKKWLA